jgi:hypothetical protein
LAKKDFTIQLNTKSQRFLDKIDQNTRESFFIVLEDIKEDPYREKLLKGNLSKIW